MKRFIRYLFEYEQGNRTRNVGFIKVEMGEAECTVHVHGKGLHLAEGETLALFLFFEDKGVPVGIFQGETEQINPALNHRLYYTEEDTKGQEYFSRIEGIILKSQWGHYFAAVWNDMPVAVERMIPFEQWEKQEIVEEESNQKRDIEEENSEARVENESEDIHMQDAEDTPRITKIQRKDLAMLPRCEWKLANNHFLLHGYYNYRYLVLIEDGEVLKLGVPGIFHEKEAQAAQALGFPEFIEAKEQEEDGQFGYWCRRVRKGPNQ